MCIACTVIVDSWPYFIVRFSAVVPHMGLPALTQPQVNLLGFKTATRVVHVVQTESLCGLAASFVSLKHVGGFYGSDPGKPGRVALAAAHGQDYDDGVLADSRHVDHPNQLFGLRDGNMMALGTLTGIYQV